jgi:hypothetical protein
MDIAERFPAIAVQQTSALLVEIITGVLCGA